MKKKRKILVGLLILVILGAVGCLFYTKSAAYQISTAKRNQQLEDRLLTSESAMSELEAWQKVNPEVGVVLEYEDEEKLRTIPVMFTPEDRDKYYRLDIYGSYDSMGTAFVDDNSTLESQNLIINGHSSKTKDQQFTFLKQFAEETYFNDHEQIVLIDETGEHRYQIILFAEFDLTLQEEGIELYSDWYNGSFRSQKDIEEMLERMSELALQKREFRYEGEKLLTLITCNMSKEDSRYVLMALEIKEES